MNAINSNFDLNRLILQGESKPQYVEEMWQLSPDWMNFKYERVPTAVYQQEVVYGLIRDLAKPDGRLLAVGSHSDPCAYALKNSGWHIDLVDPADNGIDLATAWQDETHYPRGKYDVVFSNSVMEHVPDDLEFIQQICQYLAPGGYAFLTVDYKEGWRAGDPKPAPDCRLYSAESLAYVFSTIPSGFTLLGQPRYFLSSPHFTFDSVTYGFALISFQRD